jgi:dCMP deaminase
MTQGRNQHAVFILPNGIKNTQGSHDNIGRLDELTRDVFNTRGGVIADSSGCHAWTRAKIAGHGYGVINLIGLDERRKSHTAHRVSAHLAGVLRYDDKMQALHTCDKAWCVNPLHLYAGTPTDNVRDRHRRPPLIGVARERIRPAWKVVWWDVAHVMARRSECVRRQAGCAIVGADERIVGTGFNGKPGDLNVSGPCDSYCPRATTGGSLDYSDCLFVHAEMNALMYSDRSHREGGTAYVTSCPCLACAKALATSGITHVVCAVTTADRNREPERSIMLMMNAGLHVEIWYQRRMRL